MAGPHQPTVETDDEDDGVTQSPRRSNMGSRRKSVSSNSSLTARRESKTETRKQMDKNSDSGYSTGTKGSADNAPSGKPSVERVEPAEIPPPTSPVKATRPPMDKRMPSSRSEASQRSSNKTEKVPSRAPSTKSKTTTRSDRSKEEPCPAGCEDCKKERRKSRPVETPYPSSAQYSSVRTSPTSSRSSRTTSSSSQEMPPPTSTVRPRPRSGSMSRAGRPASYHSGMGSAESYYAPSYAAYDHGPPLSRSAYVDKRMLPPVRPALNVLPSPQSYTPSVHPSQALQPSMYDPSRMALRTQTEFSTSSTSSGTQYSARRPITIYNDQPTSYDPATISPPSPPPAASLQRERKNVSARRPAQPPPYDEHPLDDESSGSDPSSEDDEYEEPPPQYMPIRRPSARDSGANYTARMARGGAMPGSYAPMTPYGTSPYGTSSAAEFPAYDPYYDDQYMPPEYRSSARSNTTNSSSQSRRQSVASSGPGTRGTSYSASSGSGGNAAQRRRSVYDQQYGTSPHDQTNSAETYMKSVDRQAAHTRYQQPPQLTQESLRLAQARAIEAKRSSKGGSVMSSQAGESVRTRTVTAGDEQTVKLVINTAAGFDVALEGDTEGRPIKLIQKPGEQTAQLIIGTGSTGRREETVYNVGSGSRGSGRTTGGSRTTSKAATSSRAAVSGKRERAKTSG